MHDLKSHNCDRALVKDARYFNAERVTGANLLKEEWEDHPLRQEWLIKEAMKEALEGI